MHPKERGCSAACLGSRPDPMEKDYFLLLLGAVKA